MTQKLLNSLKTHLKLEPSKLENEVLIEFESRIPPLFPLNSLSELGRSGKGRLWCTTVSVKKKWYFRAIFIKKKGSLNWDEVSLKKDGIFKRSWWPNVEIIKRRKFFDSIYCFQISHFNLFLNVAKNLNFWCVGTKDAENL